MLTNWKRTAGKDYVVEKGAEKSTFMAIGGLFKRKNNSGIHKTESRLSSSDKKNAMLESLNERFEFLNERLILNRRIDRSKVGLAVVVFEGECRIASQATPSHPIPTN
jgi:hypothetical protein